MARVITKSLFMLMCCLMISTLKAEWSASTTISSQISDESQVGMDGDGNAIAIWREFDGTDTNIQTAIQVKGGVWSTPVTISSVPGNNIYAAPQIAVNPTGNAVAIWDEVNGSNSTVRAATYDGSWSTPVDVSAPTAVSGQVPVVAINANGYAVALWVRNDGSKAITQSATLQFNGSWSTPVDVSSAFIDTYVPQVGIDNEGNAVAVWLDVTNQTIQSSSLPFGGSWLTPIDLSASGNSGEPKVDMNSSGYAVATWERFNGSFFAIQASTLQFGDSWSTPVEISTSGTAFESDVVIDQTGNTLVLWDQMVGSDILIQSVYLPFGGTWTTPATLSPTGALSFDPKAAFDASGNAIAVWDRDNGYDVVIQASSLPAQGSWSTPTNLSAGGQSTIFPQIAVDPTGYAVVTWTNNTLGVVQSATFTPPPTVINVSPNSGSTVGGDSIQIFGTNFIHVNSVNFGSQSASFATTSPSSIVAMSPPESAGVVDVTVTTTAGTSPITTNDQFTYHEPTPQPVISRVNPNNGSSVGGNPVRIIGANFVNVTKVSFGTANAPSFTVLSPTLIVAIAPPGIGTVDILVTTAGGTSTTNYYDHYTYHGH